MTDNDDKTSRPTHHDAAALFRAAMAEVRPLQSDKVAPERPRPMPEPRQTRRDEAAVRVEMLADPPPEADLETGEELQFSRPGLQHGLLRKLRRGQLSVGAELDLHGMTVVAAKQALVAFLHVVRRDGVRCVRIIHGKGHGSPNRQPVLKGRVDYWLKQRDEVLAFCSARPVDGGTGAVYVLLRRD